MRISDWSSDVCSSDLHLFKLLVGISPYAPLVVMPAGLALSFWITRRYFQNSQGSGIPQAIAARHLSDEDDRSRLLSLRIAIGKILLTVDRKSTRLNSSN